MAATNIQAKATFADSATNLGTAINSFLSWTPEATEEDLSELFTPTFIQRDDQTLQEFPAFVKHIRWMREILPRGSVNFRVTQFMRDGNQVAERHSGDPMTLPDGRNQWGETFMWIGLADDGRIEWIVETIKRSITEPVEKKEE